MCFKKKIRWRAFGVIYETTVVLYIYVHYVYVGQTGWELYAQQWQMGFVCVCVCVCVCGLLVWRACVADKR